MAELELAARPREVLGKNVKRLRRAGVLPGNICGRGLASLAVETPTVDLLKVLRAAGRTTMIRLQVEGEAEPRTVFLRELQRDPVSGGPLHVEFHQVSLTEKMRAEVPVILTGKSPAVDTLGGILVQQIDHVTVEALPADVPRSLEVDVSLLTELESTFHVRELTVPAAVTILTDRDAVLALVSPPRLAIAEEEEAAAAAAEAEEAAAEAEAEAAAPEEAEAEEQA